MGRRSGPSLERKGRAMIYAALIIANVVFVVLMGLLIVPPVLQVLVHTKRPAAAC